MRSSQMIVEANFEPTGNCDSQMRGESQKLVQTLNSTTKTSCHCHEYADSLNYT